MKDLQDITKNFTLHRLSIHAMLSSVEKKILQYNMTIMFLRIAVVSLGILFLILKITCTSRLSIPIRSHINATYVIPGYEINRDVGGSQRISEAPNATRRGTILRMLDESVQYVRLWHPISNPNTTQVNKTSGCNTASTLGCSELSDSNAVCKGIVFLGALLWYITFLTYTNLSYPDISFLSLRKKVMDLQEEYISTECLVDFVEMLRTEDKCFKDKEFSCYDANIFHELRYKVHIDKYLNNVG